MYTANVLKCLLSFKTEAPVAVTSTGRPKRRSRKVVDYKERDGDAPHDLEKYLERVRKEYEQRWAMSVHLTAAY